MGLGWQSGLELRFWMAGDNPKGWIGRFRAGLADRIFLYNLEKLFLQKHFFSAVKSQTAPPKMTARSVRSFHVLIKNHDLGWHSLVKFKLSSEKQTFAILCIFNSSHHVFMSHSHQHPNPTTNPARALVLLN